MSTLSMIFTSRRLHLLLLATFLGILTGFLIICFSPAANQTVLSGRVGGDFPAFYSAGQIILSGDWDKLYDPKTLENLQKNLFSENSESGFLMYAYPPFVAFILSPLAKLNYILAYFLYTCLALGILLASCGYLKKIYPDLSISSFQLLMIACLVYPLVKGLFGGQNTVLSLLCLSASAFNFQQKRFVRTGIFLGLWLFKAQFALPALILFLSSGKWRILCGFLPIASIYYLLGTIVGGWNWPKWWLAEGVAPFAKLDQIANLTNFITFKSFFTRILGGDSQFVSLLTMFIFFSMLIFLFKFWKKNLEHHLNSCLALTSCLLVVISPHALYYDAGLAFIGGIYLCHKLPITYSLLLISLTWVELFSKHLPIQPTFFLLVFLSILIWRQTNQFQEVKGLSKPTQ